MSATEKNDNAASKSDGDAPAQQQDENGAAEVQADQEQEGGKPSGGRGGRSGGRRTNKPAEQGTPIRTVCRVKCYFNNILYNPGDPGPVFFDEIPDDAPHFKKV
ncbi:MAG: hypothetical protein LUG50_03465 [Planctomycetaceae bacterium]|nr:hypothetical protein [Planctomycetaceae bacterium]